MQGRVLAQILYSMHCADGRMRHRTATALARLAREQDLRHVFVDRKGLDILIGILTDPAREPLQLKEAAGARARARMHACGSPLQLPRSSNDSCMMVSSPLLYGAVWLSACCGLAPLPGSEQMALCV